MLSSATMQTKIILRWSLCFSVQIVWKMQGMTHSFRYLCAKNYQHRTWFKRAIEKIKSVPFFFAPHGTSYKNHAHILKGKGTHRLRINRRGVELIPVSGSQPKVTEAVSPVVGCRHFLPDLQLPSQLPNIMTRRLVSTIPTDWVCGQVARGCTWEHGGWNLNPRPVDCKSSTQTLLHQAIHKDILNTFYFRIHISQNSGRQQ